MRGSSFVDGDADALELGQDVRAAGLVGDQQLAPIADRLRRHMLIGRGSFSMAETWMPALVAKAHSPT